jgi:hypothetical protein
VKWIEVDQKFPNAGSYETLMNIVFHKINNHKVLREERVTEPENEMEPSIWT